MAARRAVRKLCDRYVVPSHSTPHWNSYAHQGASQENFFPRYLHSSVWDYHICTRDRDQSEDFSRNARNTAVVGTGIMGSGSGFVLSGFSRNSVRFCSSVGAVSEGHQVGAASIPEALVDVAHEVVASGASLSPASEVAAAASESFPWTACIQYIIYDVHALTGLPWWISIALTTVLVRALVFPLVIYQVKSTARFALLRPELEKMKAEMQAAHYSPEAVAENKKKMSELFAKHKTDPFTPLIGALLQGPVFMCFFFGLRTMAEKMESFKTGGAYWFTDLTTPDDLYLFPLLTTVTFLITVEIGAAEGMQGQPNQKMIKNFLRGMGILFLPLTAAFPKALFCYWVTSNIWSLLQGIVLRNKHVKGILDIPDTAHLGQPAPTPVISSKPPSRKAAADVSFDAGKKPRRLVQ